MTRRIHIPKLAIGSNRLDEAEAHHVRDVLRLLPGAAVEIFDDDGNAACGVLATCSPQQVLVQVERLQSPAQGGGMDLVIASAVPKAGRADWMIEKLSELGVATFQPLMTARSVVHPEGKNKIERWERLAAEAAKQSHRSGVMKIAPLMPVDKAIAQRKDSARFCGWYLSTQGLTVPIASAISALPPATSLAVFIGPEGGWSEGEMDLFENAGLTAIGLTATILRVETAAIAAAAIVASLQQGKNT